MNAKELLQKAESDGLRFALDDGAIEVIGSLAACKTWASRIEAFHEQLIELLRQRDEDDPANRLVRFSVESEEAWEVLEICDLPARDNSEKTKSL